MTPLILAALLAAADPSAGQPASAPAAAAPAKTSSMDPNKMVCRSEEQIGSNIRVRRCQTQAQWESEEEQARQYFQDAHDHGAVNTAHVNSGGPGG
jgi:hypothetical protein